MKTSTLAAITEAKRLAKNGQPIAASRVLFRANKHMSLHAARKVVRGFDQPQLTRAVVQGSP